MATTSTTARLLLEAVLRDITLDGIEKDIKNPSIRANIDFSDPNLKVWGGTFENIAASTTTVIRLFGTLLDSSGATIDWATVNLVIVQNRRVATDVGAFVLVGPDVTNGFGAPGFWADASDRSQADPGGSLVVLYSEAGVPVADGATDEIAVITSAVAGSTNVFDVLIAGIGA